MAKVKFVWGEEEEDSFQKLKESTTDAPLLGFPEGGGGFVLNTDASEELLCDRERTIGNWCFYKIF